MYYRAFVDRLVEFFLGRKTTTFDKIVVGAAAMALVMIALRSTIDPFTTAQQERIRLFLCVPPRDTDRLGLSERTIQGTLYRRNREQIGSFGVVLNGKRASPRQVKESDDWFDTRYRTQEPFDYVTCGFGSIRYGTIRLGIEDGVVPGTNHVRIVQEVTGFVKHHLVSEFTFLWHPMNDDGDASTVPRQ